MKVISVFTVKGGVGKTTTLLNLAGIMADEGYKILMLDNDPQSNVTQILELENQEFSMYDLYTNRKILPEDCIVEYDENIDIITNTIESAKLDRELNGRKNRENILKSKMKNLKGYDFVLIDNSPFLSTLVDNALTLSDYYLTVIDNSPFSLKALDLVFWAVEQIQEDGLNESLDLLGILRNRFDRVTTLSKQFSELTEDYFKEDLFNTTIYDSVKYKEAIAMNKLISRYDKKYSKPYVDLFEEIKERIN